MRATLLAAFVAAVCIGLLSPAQAQAPPSPEIVQLRREIAQAKAMIAKWQTDLAALEARLAELEGRALGGGALRFPWDVERAMIGEGIGRSREYRSFPLPGQQPREFFRNGSSPPPGVPRR